MGPKVRILPPPLMIKNFKEFSNENSSRKKVFLGGTCAESTWRDELIPMLKIDYFNPVVDDWNDEAYRRELHEREVDDFCLYVLTSQMQGYYSIAEVVDDSNKRPEKCVLCVLKDGFDDKQLKSWTAIEKMVAKNGGKVCQSLEEVAEYLNER